MFSPSRINSINGEKMFYCRLNLTVVSENIELIILQKKLSGFEIISGQTIFMEILHADIL
jgi:hypothetical protein